MTGRDSVDDAIQVNCPFCAHEYGAVRGQSATCPECQTTVTKVVRSTEEDRGFGLTNYEALMRPNVHPANPNGLASFGCGFSTYRAPTGWPER